MKPLVIRMDRGAAIVRLPNQRYYFNTQIQTDPGIEIWGFCEGRFRKIRKTDKEMINPDSSVKGTVMDPRNYDVYLVDKSTVDTGDSDTLGISLDAGGRAERAAISFSYRIIDAPSLITELRLSKRQYSHVALKRIISEAIIDIMVSRGIGEMSSETLRSDLAEYSSKLYKAIQDGCLLGYLGVELVNLKLTLR